MRNSGTGPFFPKILLILHTLHRIIMFLFKRAGGGTGRRDGLKSRWAHAREGSTPSLPTNLDEVRVFTYRGKPIKDVRTGFRNCLTNHNGIWDIEDIKDMKDRLVTAKRKLELPKTI